MWIPLLLAACTPDRPSGSPTGPCAEPWLGLPTEGALHVGEGQPYGRIQEAVAAAGPGATIAVHAGTYDGGVDADVDRLTLVGECADAVFVEDAEAANVVALVGDGATLAGMTLSGGLLYGVFFGGEDATLTGVDLVDITGTAAGFAGGENRATGVRVLREHCLGSLATCSGLNVVAGHLVVSEAYLAELEGSALVVSDDGSLEVDHSVIEDGRPGALPMTPAAESLGGDLHLGPEVEIRRMRGNAVMAQDGHLTTSGRVEIRETSTLYSAFEGAIALYTGADVELTEGVVLADNQAGAISDGGARRVRITGARIEGNCVVDNRIAALALGDATATVSDTTLTDNRCGGLYHFGTVDLIDVTADGNSGYGVAFGDGEASLTGVTVRNTVSGAGYEGIGVLVVSGTLTATDLVTSGNGDAGLVVRGGRATVERLTAEGNRGVGIAAIGSNVHVQGGTITGTDPVAERDWGGYGALAARTDASTPEGDTETPPSPDEPDLQLVDCTVDAATRAGVVAAEGTWVVVEGVTVTGTRAGGTEGDGARALPGSRLDLEGVVFRGNSRASVVYDAATGTVTDTTGDEALGLVEQRCDGGPSVEVTGSTFAAEARCTDAPPLDVAVAPFAWSNDITIAP